ncbi:MAG: type VI secretion system ImpA family N-terminal domain-containing protein, partial [Nannocystaceae bacterium]|nr:type VI secretion system ImpA family N-terminal domain-containing protein [Nannocystaceae bacterium]
MTQAAEELRGRAAPLLQPIAGDNPAGENAQYDARHEAVRAEVAKLDAMSGGEVAWNTVVSSTTALLTETSKDLLMGSYLTYGLLQTEGLTGLATGLELMRGMMAEFWESMFPPLKRMRARTNALDWLVSKLELALPTLSLSATDRPALDSVTEAFKAFGAMAREKMEGATPGMSPVSQALQRLDMKV